MRSVTSLVRRLQRFADRPQTLDDDDVQDACQQLEAACDGMTAEQLVQQQVVSALAQLACVLLGIVEQQQQLLAAMQTAGGDMAPALVFSSMLAVEEQLRGAGNVLALRWSGGAASRAAAADAAAQIQRTALLPRLARQMEAVRRAALSCDGTALSALALAEPGSGLVACTVLLLWYQVLHVIWPSSLLASSAAGPVSVAAGQLLVAALMLTELCLARGEGGVDAMEERTVFVVRVCRKFVGAVSLGREQVAVMQAPFLRQVLQSPAYPHLLLAHCLLSCGRLLQKHGDAAAQQSLLPVALQVGSGLGLGPRLVRWCMHTAESPYPAEVDFENVVRELCTRQACDAIAQQQPELMVPMALLLLSTVAACVDRAGEEAPMLVCAGACGAEALLMRLMELHHTAAAAAVVAGIVELLACALQLLELLLVQHRTSHDTMHAQTGVSLVQVLCCIALCAGRDDSDVWHGVLVRICSAAESLLRAPLLRGPDRVVDVFNTVCVLVQGGVQFSPGMVRILDAQGPLLAAASGDQQQQQTLFSLVVTVCKLLPELQQQHKTSSQTAWVMVAGQLAAVLAAARGGSGGGGGGSSSASGTSSSSSVLHASSSGVPWLVLAAHAAHQAGTLLAAAAAAPGAAQSAAPADAIRQWCQLQASVVKGMQGVCRALLCSEPGTAAPAATAAAAPDVQLVQELQQELLPAAQQGEALLSRAVSAVQSEGGTSSNSSNSSGDSGGVSVGSNHAVAAAGIDPALLAAVNTAAAVSSAEVLLVLQRSFVATALPQQLQDWAARLSAALPHRYCCNHPGCTNLAGVSELALVGGKSCICAGCRTVRYCSAACQAAHWPQHRPVCRRLMREAAAAAAAAAVSAAGVPAPRA